MRIAPPSLESLAISLFAAAGVTRDEATLVARSLVESNLQGHDSHGVMRIPDYVEQLGNGELVAGAEFEILTETPAMLVVDAHRGFGQVQTGRLMDRLAEKAKVVGIASGAMRNCGHVGRLGEWVERAARRQCAGFVTVNDNGVLTCVAPPGGIEPRISTNPLALGVPLPGEPLVFDMSTSAVANGKVRVAMLAGKTCPEGWLQDAAGNPTRDPATRFASPPGTLLPMGGETQGYKGFALGLMLDILSAGLAGGFCPPAPADAPLTNNVLAVVWSPALFSGATHFEKEAEKLIDAVRTTPRKSDVESIRLPGDRAATTRAERHEAGIPLDSGTWRSLEQLATRLGVPFEASRAV